MKDKKQAESKSRIKGDSSAFLFPNNSDSGESCVICGAAVPEGQQVCPACQASNAWLKSKKEGE